MKTHNPQLTREVRWAMGLSVFYLVAWGFFAYFFPANYGILGFPLWFELSCIFFPMLFILMVYVVVKTVYKEIDLDAEAENE